VIQELSFEDLVEATMRLQPEQRQVLAQLLHVSPTQAGREDTFPASIFLGEAGAYSVFIPLDDVHPQPHLVTEAELLAAVQSISSEWEEESL
jgi:hypothetical protein